MNSIEIRKATIEDIPALQKSADITFRHTYKEIITAEQIEFMMERMYSTDSLIKQLNEGHNYYILSLNGKDAGYVSFNKENTDDESITLFHLQKIYVQPEHQGKGLGAELLLHAEKEMKKIASNNTVRYELNVNRNNKAVYFYEKMGMYKDRTGDFPIGNGFYMNDYIMAKEL